MKDNRLVIYFEIEIGKKNPTFWKYLLELHKKFYT